MGAAKDLWMDEIEQIAEQFACGDLGRDEAMRKLERKGFDVYEASAMLDAVLA